MNKTIDLEVLYAQSVGELGLLVTAWSRNRLVKTLVYMELVNKQDRDLILEMQRLDITLDTPIMCTKVVKL